MEIFLQCDRAQHSFPAKRRYFPPLRAAKINSSFLLVRWPIRRSSFFLLFPAGATNCDDAGIFLLARAEKNGVRHLRPPCRPTPPWPFTNVNRALCPLTLPHPTSSTRTHFRPTTRATTVRMQHLSRFNAISLFFPSFFSTRLDSTLRVSRHFVPVVLSVHGFPFAFIAASFPAVAVTGLSRNRDYRNHVLCPAAVIYFY